MKYSTFKKNICKLIEKTLDQGKTIPCYENHDGALYFLPDRDKAYYAYRLEGSDITEPQDQARRVELHRVFPDIENCFYAERVQDYEEKLKTGETVYKFTVPGEWGFDRYFQKKFVKKFPENAKFYIPRGPGRFNALVGLWEDDHINIIGCICPMMWR
ncbi:MAG: hypothetical protein J6S14_11955 [Clostridia bacterium]|nr:hypothetical protein [Clostridia bacterium]